VFASVRTGTLVIKALTTAPVKIDGIAAAQV
jgi:hypothetical protein